MFVYVCVCACACRVFHNHCHIISFPAADRLAVSDSLSMLRRLSLSTRIYHSYALVGAMAASQQQRACTLRTVSCFSACCSYRTVAFFLPVITMFFVVFLLLLPAFIYAVAADFFINFVDFPRFHPLIAQRWVHQLFMLPHFSPAAASFAFVVAH